VAGKFNGFVDGDYWENLGIDPAIIYRFGRHHWHAFVLVIIGVKLGSKWTGLKLCAKLITEFANGRTLPL
jgi:hypothetical protein